MLNENQLYNNKLKFLELLGKLNIDLTPLVKYLDTHDYFNKPASSQYFRPYAGGLCQYALDLYYELAQLVNAYCPGKYTEEDVIKLAREVKSLNKDYNTVHIYGPENIWANRTYVGVKILD